MTLNPLTSIDYEIAERLENDEEFRRQFIRFWAANDAAGELRNLRKKRDLTQKAVADLAGTGQSAISRIEKADYDGWTFKTLVTIAEALRARLRITFEPLEEVVNAYRGAAVAAESEVVTVVTEETAAGVQYRAGIQTALQALGNMSSVQTRWQPWSQAALTAMPMNLRRSSTTSAYDVQ